VHALLCFAFGAGALRAQASLATTSLPPAQRCTGSLGDTATVSLSCVVLIPVPDLPSASGSVAMLPIDNPFGVAVTVDGHPRYHLVASFAGLPDPHSLGNFTGYVAWAYSLALDSAVKLAPIANGRIDLGELDYLQFRILISAERSPSTVKERTGRLVLRGTSPSARLMMHRDLLQPSAPGMLQRNGSATRETARAWSMPPMRASTPMMPAMSGLVPPVTPFLPSRGGSPPRIAQPRRIVRLASGDTLTLTAAPAIRTLDGKTLTLYAYNGQAIGPLLDVRQGATIVVRYRNALEAQSSVHWHGVRLDNRFDGTADVTQRAVPPGGSFTYTLHFPDAGIFWYHPHVREDTQQDLGLYGNIIVRPTNAHYYNDVNREEILALDDVLVGDEGLVPYGAESPTHALMGRFGNVFLVNGVAHDTLDVRRNEVVRFYLTNASNARTYNLSFDGARMKLVAGDVSKFEHEAWVTSIPIAPAERYVVEVRLPRTGVTALVNRVQALEHVYGTYSPETDTVALVRVGDANVRERIGTKFDSLRADTSVASDVGSFRKYFVRPVDHSLVLTLRTHGLPDAVANMLLGINASMEWNDGMPMMNWLATGSQIQWILRDPATGKENMDIGWHFAQGDVAKIRIFNDPASSHAMQHPIHLHGQRFLVIARDGVSATNLVWKDTAIIPAGETVDLLVDLSNPGQWMLHCHIAEHLSAGMMTMITVEPRAARPTSLR
jgi:suppressor of ftsI